MKEHLMLNVDDLSIPEPNEVTRAVIKNKSSGETIAHPPSMAHAILAVGESMVSEEEPLLQVVECRICQEEDSIKNLESPCACTGSLKYAHRACVQRWCNEKGDVTCEICHEPYEHGYTAPPRAHPDETTIDISGGWTITGTAFDLRDPRILAVAQNHIMEAEYDDYSATNASTAAFCRSAALVLMALLLLRHALTLTDEDDDDTSAMFSLFLLRAAGFLLPFYIMAWAISILQRRRQRQSELPAQRSCRQVAPMARTRTTPPSAATTAATAPHPRSARGEDEEETTAAEQTDAAEEWRRGQSRRTRTPVQRWTRAGCPERAPPWRGRHGPAGRRQLLLLQRRWHSSCSRGKEGEYTSPSHRTPRPHHSMNHRNHNYINIYGVAGAVAGCRSLISIGSPRISLWLLV